MLILHPQSQALCFSQMCDSVAFRTCTAGDARLLEGMYGQLSTETIRLRHCCTGFAHLGEREAARLCQADGRHHTVLLALAGDQVVGIGELAGDEADPGSAEVALLVRDDCQRQGVGTQLAKRLFDHASAVGITTVEAYVSFENVAITRLIHSLPVRRKAKAYPGGTQFTFELRIPA